MNLRLSDLQDLNVLKEWDTKKHVIEASGDTELFDWEYEISRYVDWREILIAEVDGRPIGVLVVIDPEREETHYWGDVEPNLRAIDIWIGEEADLNRGYGTQMMILALDRCFHNPQVKGVITDPLVSNTKAIRFYERLGFKRIGRRKVGNDDCFVYRLERSGWLKQNREKLLAKLRFH